MNPKMNTSVRGRGKWGDFVVALIPASWCLNILLNSNFILRMIEWQNESSLFTIRIHGKQWYWVYKFDLKNTMDIFTAPKTMGRGRWFVQTPSDLLVTDTYLQAVHLRAKSTWMGEYWGEVAKKEFQTFTTSELLTGSPVFAKMTKKQVVPGAYPGVNFDVYSDASTFSNSSQVNKHYEYIDLDNEWDIKHNLKKKTAPGPVRIMKTLYSNLSPKGGDLLKVRFIDSNDQTEAKISSNSDYFVLKQKRYKKKQTIKNTIRYEIDPNTAKKTKKNSFLKFYSRRLIRNNLIIDDTHNIKAQDSYSMYKLIRNNRKRAEQLPVTLCRRLLRTKRTLVLPAHTNLTIVTNSYDVVHSWFIPGLGIKLDCVPGRSTHHSFYLDNIGFYYGQCAEICGRYHHHMPIRLCALPFEHFVVWWQTKGLPKLLKLNLKKKNVIEYSSMKYIW